MHLASFLPGWSEQQQQQQHYKRLEWPALVQEDGDSSDSKQDGDRASLLCKARDDESEEQLAIHRKTPQRFKAFASPRRPTPEPSHGTMNLLIRRMDDTTFVLGVSKKATLLDLKEAIRVKFQADGCQVSWPHVWGHFCLSFKDQKLLEEQLVLYRLGVRDLDELVFVRHLDTRPHKGSQHGSFFSSLRRKHRLTI